MKSRPQCGTRPLRVKVLGTVLLLPVLLAASVSAQGPGAKELSAEQAELLARTAVQVTEVGKHRFVLEQGSMHDFPDFYFFDVLVAEPGAQGISAHYAVNKFTADIWDPFGCSRVSNPRLRELQRKLRKDLGLNVAEYRRKHKGTNPCLV